MADRTEKGAPTPKGGRQTGRRWIIILAMLAGLAAAGVWGMGLLDESKPDYITAKVVRGDLEKTVLATGIVKPASLIAVGSQVSGRILTVDVKLGQRVKAGDKIAQIEAVTQRNSLRTAEAELARIRAQRAEKAAALLLAEHTLIRRKKMLARSAVSLATLESGEADVAMTKAQIAALDAQIVKAEVAVETAKSDLGHTTITAPVSGTVLAIVNRAGTTVNAAQSTPTIVVLGRLDEMIVRAEISEVDIVNVRPAQKIWFTILGAPERRFHAELGSIEPAPESITSDRALTTSTSSSNSTEAVYYIGVFNVKNDDGVLRPYMTAEAHIVLGRAKNALLIPATALGAQGKDGRYAVKVLTAAGKVEARRVAVGLNDKIRVEAKSGLAEGERVIISGASASVKSTTRTRMGPPPMGF
ncbi:MAG: efflux RND transporter periplasmic adaptor subunit [Neomegalonema sp.]|nr:efflux RND transporter periplasmic adaptor subunit [Neomegalonema sp.]